MYHLLSSYSADLFFRFPQCRLGVLDLPVSPKSTGGVADPGEIEGTVNTTTTELEKYGKLLAHTAFFLSFSNFVPAQYLVLVFFIYYRRSSQLEAPRPCISELNCHDEENVLLWIELLMTSILIKLPDDQDRKKFQLENKTNYNSSAVLHISEMIRTLALTLGFQDKALECNGADHQCQ